MNNEFEAIKDYLGKGADRLNRDLRSHNREFRLRSAEKEVKLNQELDLLPSHSHNILYGHDLATNIEFEVLSIWYKKRIGETIMFPNFLSTTFKRFKDHAYTTYQISSLSNSNGKDISNLSENYENEVLFKSKTKFKIISVDTDIFLEEDIGEDIDNILYEGIFKEDIEIKELIKLPQQSEVRIMKSATDLGEI